MAIFILSCALVRVQNNADDIIGNWLAGEKEPAKIQVYKSGEKYFEKITGYKILLQMESQGWMERTRRKVSGIIPPWVGPTYRV